MKNQGKNFLLAVLFGFVVGQLAAPKLIEAYTDSQATMMPGDLKVNGDLRVVGNDLLDSDTTTRLTLGATNAVVGALTTTGSITPTGRLINSTYQEIYTRTSAQIKVTTPTVVGQMVYDTTLKQIVVGTGTTNYNDWANSTGTIPSGY